MKGSKINIESLVTKIGYQLFKDINKIFMKAILFNYCFCYY